MLPGLPTSHRQLWRDHKLRHLPLTSITSTRESKFSLHNRSKEIILCFDPYHQVQTGLRLTLSGLSEVDRDDDHDQIRKPATK